MGVLFAIMVLMFGLQQFRVDSFRHVIVVYCVPILCFCLLSFLNLAILFLGDLSTLLLVTKAFVLDQIDRLVVPPSNLFLSFHSVPHPNRYPSATGCPFDVNRV